MENWVDQKFIRNLLDANQILAVISKNNGRYTFVYGRTMFKGPELL